MAYTQQRIVKSTTNRGREYATYSDSTQWSRKVDADGKPLSEWRQVESIAPAKEKQQDGTTPDLLKLYVIAENQAEGEPKHWFLYAASSGEEQTTTTTTGQVWQVTGDAEFMHFEHFSEVDDPFRSDSFAWHQTVNARLQNTDVTKVDQLARAEPPPQAKSRKEVKENCQGWTIRLLGQLAAEGLAEKDAAAKLQGYLDPV